MILEKHQSEEGPVGEVVNLFVAPEGGRRMEEREVLRALKGIGFEGDRYAEGVGFFNLRDKQRKVMREGTLMAIEALEEVVARGGLIFLPEETRRNVITRGIDPNELVGRRFRIGKVQMRGIEVCTPCRRPSDLCGKPNFQDHFAGRGGLRFKILKGGLIHRHDAIEVL